MSLPSSATVIAVCYYATIVPSTQHRKPSNQWRIPMGEKRGAVGAAAPYWLRISLSKSRLSRIKSI